MRRGGIIAIVAGAVLLAAGGAGAWWWLASRPESPESAAQRYVTALEDGDRSTLAGFLADDAQRDVLLDAYAGASARIGDAKLSAPASQGDLQGFRADVTLDGAPGVVLFSLARSAGSWRLAGDYLATLDVTTTMGTQVAVGETVVDAGQVPLLPAVYVVHAAPTALLDGETTVAVTNEKPVTAAVTASLSPDATASAQQQLDAYARTCAAGGSEVPAHCGLKVPWGADLTELDSIAFRVEKTPRVVLSADATTFAATGGVIVATAKGPSRSGGDGSFTYRNDAWSMYGDARFDGGQLVLAVR